MAIFRAAAPPEFFLELRKASGQRAEGGVYTVELTTWMMMRQRLEDKATLSTAVQEVTAGRPQALLPSHKRLVEGTLSSNTGAYSLARQRLDKETSGEVADRIFNYLIADAPEALPGLGRRAFLLDGSSLDLPATPELLKAYPPAQNQHGSAHFPVVRIVAATDLVSGMATLACVPHAALLGTDAKRTCRVRRSGGERAGTGCGRHRSAASGFGGGGGSQLWRFFDSLRCPPAGLSGGCTADRQPCPLPAQRPTPAANRSVDRLEALALGSQSSPRPASRSLCAGPCDRLPGHQQGQNDPTVFLHHSRVAARADRRTVWIRLRTFRIVGTRLRAFRIETDLRTLKQTLHLQSLTSRSVDMMAKELVLGVAAYNLVRGAMCAAARLAGIDPRQLSFSRVQDVVNAFLPNLTAAASPEIYQRELDRMLRRAAQCKLPHRPERPTYPRAKWHRSSRYRKQKDP